MTKWLPCGGKLDIGDVVRWTEPVWHEYGRRKKNKKRSIMRLGERKVTGQVLTHDAKDFFHISVMKCEILRIRYGVGIDPFEKDKVIKRKRGTIAKYGERMVSKAEAAPRLPASKFTGPS